MKGVSRLISTIRIHGWPLLLILVVTFVVFLPVLKCEFVDYDDTFYISDNPWVVHPFSWHNLHELWSRPMLRLWHPLTSITLHLIYLGFGLHARAYHATSLVMHMGSVAMVYALWVMLTGSRWRSMVVALFFAIHPLRVESIAWASEMKDVGCVFFALACMIAYVSYVRCGSRDRLVLAVLFLTVSLLYKPMFLIMPALLLLLDYWPLGRTPLSPPLPADPTMSTSSDQGTLVSTSTTSPPQSTWRKLLIEKLWFCIPIAGMLWTILDYALHNHDEGMGDISYPLWLRLTNIPISYVRYIGKMFWFDGLTYHYPMPAAWPLWQVTGALAILVAITATAWKLRDSRPMWITGWLWFVVSLLPVCGINQISDYAMADRYTYLASLGLVVMLIFGLPDDWFRTTRARAGWIAIVVLVVVMMGVSTRTQITHWRNGMALYAWEYEVYPKHAYAHVGLGGALVVSGKFDLAAQHFEEALRLDPDSVGAHYKYAVLLRIQGKYEESLKHLKWLSVRTPRYAAVWILLGDVYSATGQLPKAIEALEQAVRVQPDSPATLGGLALAYQAIGRDADAEKAFNEALAVSPKDNPALHFDLGILYISHGRHREAIAQLEQAVLDNPDYIQTRQNLGAELVRTGQYAKGLDQLRWCLNRQPHDPGTLYFAAQASLQLGDKANALEYLRHADRLKPGDHEIQALLQQLSPTSTNP